MMPSPSVRGALGLKGLLALALVIAAATVLTPGAQLGPWAARGVLAAGALVAVGLWLRRAGGRPREPDFSGALQVIGRAGLSPRCGVALIAVEGSRFLVTFGDTFVDVHRASSSGPAPRAPWSAPSRIADEEPWQ